MIRSLEDGLHASGFSGDALLRPHYAVGYKSVNLMDWTCAANSHVGQDLCETDFQMRFLETRFQKPQSQFRKKRAFRLYSCIMNVGVELLGPVVMFSGK